MYDDVTLGLVIPRAHTGFCTRRVLIIDWINGTKFPSPTEQNFFLSSGRARNGVGLKGGEGGEGGEGQAKVGGGGGGEEEKEEKEEELEAWGRLIDIGVQAEILKSTHCSGVTW
jgi:hypothetical protein